MLLFFFFELKDIIGKSPPRLRGRIALVLRPILKFQSVRSALMKIFDLNFYQATDLYFLGCLLGAMQPS